MTHVFHHADAVALVVGATARIDGDDGHHAVRVRRISVGESVELVDGAGTRARGRVHEVGKSTCVIEVLSVTRESEPHPKITVLQALVKKDRSDQAIELLTEAGVDHVIGWQAQRSQTHELPVKWPRLAIEASKQSRRARFPQITGPLNTSAAVALVADVAQRGCVIVCHEARAPHISRHLREVVRSNPTASEYLIIIGPEGGLTEAETESFVNVGAHIAWMGPTVMRAATAGAVASSIVAALTDRWNEGANA